MIGAEPAPPVAGQGTAGRKERSRASCTNIPIFGTINPDLSACTCWRYGTCAFHVVKQKLENSPASSRAEKRDRYRLRDRPHGFFLFYP